MTILGRRETATWSLSRWWLLGIALLVMIGANVMVFAGGYASYASPLLGFAAFLGVPTFLLYGANFGNWESRTERLVFSVLGALLVSMLMGLIVDVVLPHLGVARPLDTRSVLTTGDVGTALLALLTVRRHPPQWVLSLPVVNGADNLVLIMSAVTIPLAAMGAVRLDNGAGGGLTHATLAVIVLAFATLYITRGRLAAAVPPVAIYCLSLAMLFMTSLRGWFTTGHDVQHEMLVFHNTLLNSRYTLNVHDAYNACLSITILPTLIERWTRVSDPYVFKVFFQLLYALCPVIIYRVVRRLGSPRIAIVSVVWFVGFIGFLQDMPMLNRQELGFLFFASMLICLLAEDQKLGVRRIWFCALATGMVVSHYATTYFAIGALAITYVLQQLLRYVLRRTAAPQASTRLSQLALFRVDRDRPWALNVIVLAFVAVASIVWTGPLTHTSSGLTHDIRSTFNAAVGNQGAPRAPEASYALVPIGKKTTASQALIDLTRQATAQRAGNPAAFYANAPVDPVATPVVPQEQLRLTYIGRALHDAGLRVRAFNHVFRVTSALILQVLIFLGTLAVFFARRRVPVEHPEAVLMGFGLLLLTAVQILLPLISLDYGVGRSFMQSLMLLSPFIVIGSTTLLRQRWRTFANGFAATLALLFLTSSTGVITQALGGYFPQLHLNNSGDYYDRYYFTDTEHQTLLWLQHDVIARSTRYPDLQIDAALLNKARSVATNAEPITGFATIYPALIHRDSYVVLGSVNIVDRKSEQTVDGYELWYAYPLSLLDNAKNLIFTTGTTRVYR